MKDADAVRNVARILQLFPNDQLIVVISAMGKTTNALERLIDAFFYKKEDPRPLLEEIREFHLKIAAGLFPDRSHKIYEDIHNTLVELEWAIEDEPTHTYDCEYDQVVSVGELLSTKIVSAYLASAGVKNKWWDVRDFIKTDNTCIYSTNFRSNLFTGEPNDISRYTGSA